MDRGAQSAAAHGVKYEQATSTHRAVFISVAQKSDSVIHVYSFPCSLHYVPGC